METEFHRQFDVNALGTILVARGAVESSPALGGSTMNMSSTASANPKASSVVYSATKPAVDTITRKLCQELGPRGIRLNAIAPGGVETEGTRANGVVGGEAERRIVAATPLGRFGQPKNI